MAARKKTTQKKSTTTQKSSAKEKTNVKIMYSPVGLTAEYMNIPLKKKKIQDGTVNLISTPLIEGLPMELHMEKGEVLEVTPEQLEQLRALKVVETQEEHDQRLAFIKNLPDQYPEDLSAVEKAEREHQLLTAWDAQNRIYSDKLIICD